MTDNKTEGRVALLERLADGESETVEFKERLANLDKDLVAFSNFKGGSIFLGVDDSGRAVGIEDTNRLRSEVQSTARNCDPPIEIEVVPHPENVLEVRVPLSMDPPHRCRLGFFVRKGASSQKMTRDEISEVLLRRGRRPFDSLVCAGFRFPDDFDVERLERFKELASIRHQASDVDILISIGVAKSTVERVAINNAGVLFFAQRPESFIQECGMTCVQYRGEDRFDVIARLDVDGDPIQQIEQAVSFIETRNARRHVIDSSPRRRDTFDYPMVAVREAVTNAVMHRDYAYATSRIYVHLFSDRLEVVNPGGLPSGLTIEEIGSRSVRRNPLVADMLYRAGYVERIGSGIARMRDAAEHNGNPQPELSSTSFFDLRIRIAPRTEAERLLTPRQQRVWDYLQNRAEVSKSDVAAMLGVGGDTALRELKQLIEIDLVAVIGRGRGTRYQVANR